MGRHHYAFNCPRTFIRSSHVHENGIIHADLKPENILIRKWDIAKGEVELILTDFGASKNAANSIMLTTMVASPLYMAPEIALNSPRRVSDHFALGMILLEGLSGKHPYLGLNMQQLLLKAASNTRLSTASVPQKWRRVIDDMLEPEGDKRSAFIESSLEPDMAPFQESVSSDTSAAVALGMETTKHEYPSNWDTVVSCLCAAGVIVIIGVLSAATVVGVQPTKSEALESAEKIKTAQVALVEAARPYKPLYEKATTQQNTQAEAARTATTKLANHPSHWVSFFAVQDLVQANRDALAQGRVLEKEVNLAKTLQAN